MPQVAPGKRNIKDARLDQVDGITKSKKKVYIQAELVGQDDILDADAVIAPQGSAPDLVLTDLEFVENRLSKVSGGAEKELLEKFKACLEKEQFISSLYLSDEERKAVSGYALITIKPVIIIKGEDADDLDAVVFKAFTQSGNISFFTTGEKETRAWLLKKGATAWEASGAVHSDIQRGFIRAEIISFNDFISCGGENAAKQAGKLRLEQKDYVMQDCDLANFRFNK